MTTSPNICELVRPIVATMKKDAAMHGIVVSKGPLGCTLIDCGIRAPGSIEAGLQTARVCMGGLGHVQFVPWPYEHSVLSLMVSASQPVIACLASQYAGWNLGTSEYHALGSGPARALAQREKLFEELNYQCSSKEAVLVLEVNTDPPESVVKKAADGCKLSPSAMTFVLTPTRTLAGMVQIIARVLEVALHKAHECQFDLSKIVGGIAYAPFLPPAESTIESMGRSNDAIIYGGMVHLYIDCDDTAARTLSKDLPSSNSRDYGKPFAAIYERYKGDFYAIDGSLFSPARVAVTSMQTGKTFEGGHVNWKVLFKSFGYAR